MSVWCHLKVEVRKPYNKVSIRKLSEELFESVVFKIYEGTGVDYFEINFIQDGLQAAKEVQQFCDRLRAEGIKSDCTAEIRFLT
jgi:uncharacterized alkaline shock family protein YloU